LTRGVLVALAALPLAAGLARWRGAPASDAEARRRLLGLTPPPGELNLLLITLGTTRPDRLGCYGSRDGATPAIDALAAEGVLFEQALAVAPLTLPSHASLLTGLLPPHHGVRDDAGFSLAAARTTLAERLEAAGYATGAFVGAWTLASRWGLGQGFDAYSDRFDLSDPAIALGHAQKRGEQVVADALAWLDTVKQRRFFAWVQLNDPHAPYDPPEPYASRYPGRAYLGEIAYADAMVGRLLGFLRGAGLVGRTLVVLTADHGEGLGEHGEATHACFVYESTLRVPLIVRTPWGLAGRSRSVASGADVFPTLLDLLGLSPQPQIDGRSLARALFQPGLDLGHAAYAESLYPRYHYGWHPLRSLRRGAFKYVDAPDPELYDVAKDPGERRNQHASLGSRAQELRLELRLIAGDGAVDAPSREGMDPDALQRLARLGYLGSATLAGAGTLPDPKERIDHHALIEMAREDARRYRGAEAIAALERVAALDPKLLVAPLSLGRWYAAQNRSDEAIGALERALALAPGDEQATFELSRVRLARGEPEAAVAAYRDALHHDLRSAHNWCQLGALCLELGRLAEAEEAFRQALERNPRMGAAYNGLAATALARQHPREAERLVRRGLELEPELRTGRFQLAGLLERRGERAAAEALYRAELAQYPDLGAARLGLARLLEGRGDRQGYLAELGAAIREAPGFGPAYLFLAREELQAGGLDDAERLARRGLVLAPASEHAPLGHFVIADVYARRGDRRRAEEEAAKGRRLEAQLRALRPPAS
jgi:arylsulfatase A-like enzyme/Tfp pilus assembly protein PilF